MPPWNDKSFYKSYFKLLGEKKKHLHDMLSDGQ